MTFFFFSFFNMEGFCRKFQITTFGPFFGIAFLATQRFYIASDMSADTSDVVK
jgi:hypothetical protein